MVAELMSSDTLASMFSDVFAQIGSRLNSYHSETVFYDPSARVAAISTIDKGIEATKQFLRSLFTCRNTLVPISVLPPEILARVFHFLALGGGPFGGRRNLGWISVTHVCRHWRQVALDNSSLWANIWTTPKNTQWISEMLARSKNAPLDIVFNADAKSIREALLMIIPHISRTRKLHLYNLSTRQSDGVREIYSCEAPALEHFVFTAEADSPNIFRDLNVNILFKGHFPRLRTFSISQIVIPWSLVPRGQLTQLEIICRTNAVDPPGDVNELIDLLDHCPSLEILTLDSSLPFQLTGFSHGRTIHLPHLSRLRLRGSISCITNMLKMLKLPSSTTLHLKCISRTTDNDSECLLLPVISAQLQGLSPVEFKTLTVTIPSHYPSSLNINASTSPSEWRDHQLQSFEDDVYRNPELVLLFTGYLGLRPRQTFLSRRAKCCRSQTSSSFL